MGCCSPSSTFGFERIFNRILCVLACCGVKVVVQNSEFCDGEKLASIYLDPSHRASFSGLDAVYRAVKEKRKTKISRKQVQTWLSQQDVYTFHKPARRHNKRSRVIVPGINGQFQADLVDLQISVDTTKGINTYILGDRGAVSRVGRKGGTKVFKYGRKSPWVPTLIELFPKIQAKKKLKKKNI